MPLDTFFTVRNEDLARLDPAEAVQVFRELIWAEATDLGIGKNLISVPSAITVADGGVDAEVTDVEIQGGQGIIKLGLTRYQIKTGDFNLGQERYINEILFRSGTQELKPRVKSCLDQNGTFVVVLFGWDNPVSSDNQLIEKFRENLMQIDANYVDADIEIWQQSTLVGFLGKYPSLALRVNGRDNSRFQSHRSWSQQEDMRQDFQEGTAQSELIDSLREAMRDASEAVHVRVWGDPGIGKTKFVLESLGGEDLSPLVLYVDSPDKFRDSDLMNEILRDDNSFSVLLVIDECDQDARSYIWNKLKNSGTRIKLITIYSEYDITSGNTVYLDVPLLEADEIKMIIESHGVPPNEAERWAEICSGSPRVAHVIGQNLINNPEDLLRPPDTVNIWDRYVVGTDDPINPTTEQRKVALRHVALFKRFGFGRAVNEEAQAIATIVEKADPSITWPRFQAIVGELRNRRILQGETTLYITPKALHIELWVEWWEIYGNGFDLDDFIENLKGQLLNWFFEMFKYAQESDVATRVVADLLGPQGPFGNEEFLKTELGGKFFLALTEANPEKSLERLKATVGQWNVEEIKQFEAGRRQVVWALERIVVWRPLFQEAAELLLALAEGENENWSNNASGEFTQLFSPGYGVVASSEASPEERFPVLQRALASESKERRMLALRGCGTALTTANFSRVIGAEYQGLRRRPKLWMPENYGELFDSYRRVWKLICENLDRLAADERKEATNILLQHSRGLTRFEQLSDMVIDTMYDMVQRPDVEDKGILETAVQILHYDGKTLPVGVRNRWEQLRDSLTGTEYSSLMRRYVGTDLLEDRFDEDGNQVDQKQSIIEDLAQQSIEDPELLRPELEWLVTTEAADGHRFGYELGKRDKGFSLISLLVEAQGSAEETESLFFLGGYFRFLAEIDEKEWEDQLDRFSLNDERKQWIAVLTSSSGPISDLAGSRMLKLAEQGDIEVVEFRRFIYGGVIRDLSLSVFEKWIEYLLNSSNSRGVHIALELYDMYYRRREPRFQLPSDLTFKLLTHPTWFEAPELETPSYGGRDDYTWSEIAKALLRDNPEYGALLANKMLENYGEYGTIVDGYHSRAQTVLNEIANQDPERIWDIATRYLGPPIDTRAHHISNWLRGDKYFDEGGTGGLDVIPLEKIWRWVDGDVESRAWYLASFVPKSLITEEGKISLAREVLARYGDRIDVRQNFSANYSTEGWIGPESLHHSEKKRQLLDFKERESDPNVIRWIDEQVRSLDLQIEQARIREEREF